MTTTIITKNSSTAGAAPLAADLVQGELAVNVTDKRLFTEDSGGTVVELGTNPSSITTSSAAITGGTINSTSVGATTASTGAFTTLSASSTLGVTGTATFSGALVANGNTTIGNADTDTITQVASYVTGTQLKSAKTATNTLNLAAYDVDGAAYTNLVTLTASNTPTLALTSTGVGTINNMSIGATTASTGAFTTLSASGNVTLGSASTNTLNVGNGGLVKDASGNVGIGTTPSAWPASTGAIDFGNIVLNSVTSAIANTSGNAFLVNNAYYNGTNWKYKDSYFATLYGSGDGTHRWSYAASGTAGNNITFTEAMRIDTSGNLLVGTASQTGRLGLYGPVSDFISTMYNTASSGPRGINIYYGGVAPNSTASPFLYCNDTAALRAEIRSNGGLANFSANNVNLSDERTKTDIQDAGGYLTKICAIPVRTFKYKDQTDDLLNLGVIAQEVEAVAPELVDVSGFGETPEDGVPLKAIYQTDLQYALMKCIQEQQALINAQQAALTTLTERITALEAK